MVAGIQHGDVVVDQLESNASRSPDSTNVR